jgi:hypothetical protein
MNNRAGATNLNGYIDSEPFLRKRRFLPYMFIKTSGAEDWWGNLYQIIMIL